MREEGRRGFKPRSLNLPHGTGDLATFGKSVKGLSSCLSDDFWFFNIWARHHFWALARDAISNSSLRENWVAN